MFDFKKDYILENDFVKLSPLLPEDFDKLVHFTTNEPELWKYSFIQANPAKDFKKYLNLTFEGRENKKEYAFIVYDKLKNKFAGSTRFYDIQIENATLQLGYTWYGKEFQGTGINNHCKYLLLEFAFEFLQMERVEFRADSQNERSIAAMKKLGCKEEGILRNTGKRPDETRRDTLVLSILKNEWKDTVKKAIKINHNIY